MSTKNLLCWVPFHLKIPTKYILMHSNSNALSVVCYIQRHFADNNFFYWRHYPRPTCPGNKPGLTVRSCSELKQHYALMCSCSGKYQQMQCSISLHVLQSTDIHAVHAQAAQGIMFTSIYTDWRTPVNNGNTTYFNLFVKKRGNRNMSSVYPVDDIYFSIIKYCSQWQKER